MKYVLFVLLIGCGTPISLTTGEPLTQTEGVIPPEGMVVATCDDNRICIDTAEACAEKCNTFEIGKRIEALVTSHPDDTCFGEVFVSCWCGGNCCGPAGACTDFCFGACGPGGGGKKGKKGLPVLLHE